MKTKLGQHLSLFHCKSHLYYIKYESNGVDILNENFPQNFTRSQCSVCPELVAVDLTILRRHYQSDWHVYNLRANLSNGKMPILNEQEFLIYYEDIKKFDSDDEFFVESIDDYLNDSSPESDEDKLSGTAGTPFLWLDVLQNRDNIKEMSIMIYKSIIFNFEEVKSGEWREICKNNEIINRRFHSLIEGIRLIILIRCGRVAAGVYSGNRCLAEKTFKKYTRRAKQGSSQSTRDNAGSGRIRSAGALIRRENEVRIIEEVHELFNGPWSNYLKNAEMIFYIQTRTSIDCLFEEDKFRQAVIKKGDSRLRTIPFTTYQPSIAELRRIERNLFFTHLPI